MSHVFLCAYAGTDEERGLAKWKMIRNADTRRLSPSLREKLSRTYDLPVGMSLLERSRIARYFPFLPTFGRPPADCSVSGTHVTSCWFLFCLFFYFSENFMSLFNHRRLTLLYYFCEKFNEFICTGYCEIILFLHISFCKWYWLMLCVIFIVKLLLLCNRCANDCLSNAVCIALYRIWKHLTSMCPSHLTWSGSHMF